MLSPRDHWRAAMQQNLAFSYFLARRHEQGVQCRNIYAAGAGKRVAMIRDSSRPC